MDTVKKAEEEQAYILRLYEPAGKHVRTGLELMDDGADCEVLTADLMERTIEPVPMEGKTASLTFRPFEIKTLKIIIFSKGGNP